ncbi:ecdysone oxidase-like [Galleria mellonella]|uniref:Ecdysone oxidase-like n=1 Tax=Galleria mellonella TaxID=7137 RepID=A0ABM3M8T1_GALME|nr:ecdysone oxidase-like [Galleria mellonella]
MDATLAVILIRTIQLALLGLAVTLSITSHLWPSETPVRDGATFDFIVVGVGTAGSVLVNRLTESGRYSVLGIEAGVDPPLESVLPALFLFLPSSRYDWNYTSENDGYTAQTHKNKNLELTSGKMLGGSTSLNHEIYCRGFPHDFDLWVEAVKDQRWSYNNCLPYFKKSEKLEDEAILKSNYKDLHGLHGTVGTTREPHDITNKYLEAFQEIGYETVLDTTESLGYSEILFTIANGIRQSTAISYLFPIRRGRKNLSLLKETLVTKIIFDKNKNARGVSVVTKEGKSLTFRARKEVIVSAGAFNSPKLLMLSGIGPKEELQKFDISVISDLPVGSNLQDHAAIPIVYRMEKRFTLIPIPPSPFKFPLPGIIGYNALNKSQGYPDYQSFGFIFQDPTTLILICTFVFAYNDDICNTLHEAGEGREILFNIPNIAHPKSRGSVKLRSTDPNDPPIINMGFFSDKEDLENMVLYLEDLMRIENTTLFKKVGAELVDLHLESCSQYEYRSKDYWRCYIPKTLVSLFLYTSTCSMGSVLDAELNVLGINRLRVIDASSMPTITSGDPGASVIMLAEKAADILKKKYYGL